MKKITKIGLFISLIGGIFILGSSVYRSFFFGIGFLYVSIFGAIGIVGVMLAYYKGPNSAKRYIFIGMSYGAVAIISIIRLGFFLAELIVGFLVVFIGSIIAYIGWHKEMYLKLEKKEKKPVKRSHVFLILLFTNISIELILLILLFYFPEFSLTIYILMLVIPIAVTLTGLLAILIESFSISTEIEHQPLKYKDFKLANPYFCENCSKYTSFMGVLCENCGAEKSLRKATKADYKQYLLKD
ncbi:MAG: hypothetical protein ACFE85_17590 [Candidatus Hodarchaeota archaeon]